MSNEQASAYAALAMKNCGISPLTVGRVLNEMRILFDHYTETEVLRKVKGERHI